MLRVKISAKLLPLLGNRSVHGSPWDLNALLILHKKGMENGLSGIDDADVYINDIGTFSITWDKHVQLLHTILQILCDNGFTINALKCKWVVKETDWLHYWLTPHSLKQ